MTTGVSGEMFVHSRLVVRGDATRTTREGGAGQRLLRLPVTTDVMTSIGVIVLIGTLLFLARPIDRSLALLALFFHLVVDAVVCLATVCSTVVLALLNGAAYLETINAAQLHSLARLLLAALGPG
jgi:Domain of unknown function (DUF4386)